jgi:MYXO-CTERM domain-containing protein
VNGGNLTVITEGSTTGASKVGGLTMGGGTLDLKDNDMVVVNTPIAGIRSAIFAGTITTTGTPPGGKTTRLGYAQGSDAVIAIANLSGQSFVGTDSLIKFTYEGDADLDGDVDPTDVGQWSGNFTGSGGSTTKLWTEGDWDYDGDVDPVDVGLWSGNFTGSGGGVLGPTFGGVSAVPEPASLTILGLAAAPLLRRRRK